MFAENCTGKPSDANPKGFFNDTEFESFCNRKFGSYFPSSKLPLTQNELERLSEIIEKRAVADVWGVKEWRIALFLQEFVSIVGEVGIIRLHRDPSRSSRSWNSAFGHKVQTSASAFELVDSQITQAVKDANVPTLAINFDNIIDEKAVVLSNLSSFVGRPVNTKVGDFIDESFRRF